MKKQILIIIFLLNFLIFIFSIYKKDLFSIVLISEGHYLNMYSSPDNSSQVINKIPAGYTNIKSTWNTINKNNDYWIELEFNEKKGWVNRKFVNRYTEISNINQEKEIENLLLNLTKSLQQKDFEIFKKIFYFLRGINIYQTSNKNFIDFKYNELNLLWEKIFNNNQNIKLIFDDMLKLLESNFNIDYFANENKTNYYIPVEIKNFQFISLSYNNKTIYIGIELWNNKAYICCFCIF